MATKFKIQQEQGFYLDRDKASMPNVPRIYVVYRCEYDSYTDTVNVKAPLFIGESQDIRALLNATPKDKNHYEDLIKEAGGVDHICYGVVQMPRYSEENRKLIRDAMIFLQKPSLNAKASKGKYTHPPIELTLEGFPKCWETTHILLPII